MTKQLPEAAMLALIGAVVVFAGLAILMLAIMVLNRLLPGNKKNKEEIAPGIVEGQSPSKESIAAIAVAVALLMEEHEAASASEHGDAPAPRLMVSPWAAAGRQQLMLSRRKAGHQWGRSSK
ncbi:MAG: OadG family protein [Chloroflexi bacterium]|nr:OadG family protein [Chloroflexota bacterium]